VTECRSQKKGLSGNKHGVLKRWGRCLQRDRQSVGPEAAGVPLTYLAISSNADRKRQCMMCRNSDRPFSCQQKWQNVLLWSTHIFKACALRFCLLYKPFVHKRYFKLLQSFNKIYFFSHLLLVRIAQSVYQKARSWTAGVAFPAGARNYSHLHSVQTGSGAHPASYSIGTKAISPQVKRPRHEEDHSPPSSIEVNTGGAIPTLPHTPSWHSA
jgi:hypothetical protein